MLTAEQLQQRKRFIGSSDSAAICGLNPYRTPYDVFCEKTGRVEPFVGNDATDAGDRLESAVISWALDKIGAKTFFRAPSAITLGVLGAHIDCEAFLDDGEKVIIEGKTGGITTPLQFDRWGEEGTADIPDHYQIQVQHQLACAGSDFQRAFVPALIPPRGFVLFVVERDNEAIDALIERCTDFWERHVKADVPPDGAPTLDVAKRLRRRARTEVAIDPALVMEWQRAKEAKKAADDVEEYARAAVLAALGDAERGLFAGGEVTYFETARKSYTVEACKFRTLRFKPTKGQL